ncbi:MAG: tetratricopeptide repeat protein [Pseudomonadota bacterium]|uniref:tetratricopeptide repeat protein n=1 Tax=Sphingobium naphthae TaxID=1886786 RepID=UPI002B186B49|nr:tetratricopeptide repeat protein [Pseudomonadota bacterium]
MKSVVAIMGLALAVSTPALAQSAPESLVVLGVPDGNLAAKALASGQFKAAIDRLEPMWPYGANDPARLINLGHAYAGAGRIAQAREAYRSARFAPEMTLVLANGQEESSRMVARRAMDRLNPAFAAR